MTLDEIIAAYIQDHREDARNEMHFFELCRRRGGLDKAIEYAGLCILPSRKRHPHQRRIRKVVLAEAKERLKAVTETLKQASDFSTLHQIVETEIKPIVGIGDLAVYDIAHRIGAYFDKPPTLVYLHSGTEVGAAALRSDVAR